REHHAVGVGDQHAELLGRRIAAGRGLERRLHAQQVEPAVLEHDVRHAGMVAGVGDRLARRTVGIEAVDQAVAVVVDLVGADLAPDHGALARTGDALVVDLHRAAIAARRPVWSGRGRAEAVARVARALEVALDRGRADDGV